jgi:hypothetical protein
MKGTLLPALKRNNSLETYTCNFRIKSEMCKWSIECEMYIFKWNKIFNASVKKKKDLHCKKFTETSHLILSIHMYMKWFSYWKWSNDKSLWFLSESDRWKLEAQVSLYRSPDINKNVCMPNISKLLFKSHTAIGFYVKSMSAHGSHLGWRSWSPDTILKVYYPRTIHAMFALNWLTGFRRKDF